MRIAPPGHTIPHRSQRRLRTALQDRVRSTMRACDDSRSAMGVDDVWLWQIGDPSDPAWFACHARRRGEAIFCGGRRRIAEPPASAPGRASVRNVSVLVTPARRGRRVEFGVLLAGSRGGRRSSGRPTTSTGSGCFRPSSPADLQRKRSSEALQQSHALKDAILSSLPARIAVLDRSGSIIAVNASWAEARWPSSAPNGSSPVRTFSTCAGPPHGDGCVSAAGRGPPASRRCARAGATRYELDAP